MARRLNNKAEVRSQNARKRVREASSQGQRVVLVQLHRALVEALITHLTDAGWREERQRADSTIAGIAEELGEYATASVSEFEELCSQEVQGRMWTEAEFWDGAAARGIPGVPRTLSLHSVKPYLLVLKRRLHRLGRGCAGQLDAAARTCVSSAAAGMRVRAQAYQGRLARVLATAVRGVASASGVIDAWIAAAARWVIAAAAANADAVRAAHSDGAEGGRRCSKYRAAEEEGKEDRHGALARGAASTDKACAATRWVPTCSEPGLLLAVDPVQSFRRQCATAGPAGLATNAVVELLAALDVTALAALIAEGMSLLAERMRGLAWQQVIDTALSLDVLAQSPNPHAATAAARTASPETSVTMTDTDALPDAASGASSALAVPASPSATGLPVLAPSSSCFARDRSLLSRPATVTASSFPSSRPPPLSPSLSAILYPTQVHLPNLLSGGTGAAPHSTQPRLVHRRSHEVPWPTSRLVPPLLQPQARSLSPTLPEQSPAAPIHTASPLALTALRLVASPAGPSSPSSCTSPESPPFPLSQSALAPQPLQSVHSAPPVEYALQPPSKLVAVPSATTHTPLEAAEIVPSAPSPPSVLISAPSVLISAPSVSTSPRPSYPSTAPKLTPSPIAPVAPPAVTAAPTTAATTYAAEHAAVQRAAAGLRKRVQVVLVRARRSAFASLRTVADGHCSTFEAACARVQEDYARQVEMLVAGMRRRAVATGMMTSLMRVAL